MLYRKLSLKLFIFYYSFITNINVFVNLLFFCNTLKNISKIKKLTYNLVLEINKIKLNIFFNKKCLNK